MSAKQQARDAVQTALIQEFGRTGAPMYIDKLADAASAVWEPIVRDLVAQLETRAENIEAVTKYAERDLARLEPHQDEHEHFKVLYHSLLNRLSWMRNTVLFLREKAARARTEALGE